MKIDNIFPIPVARFTIDSDIVKNTLMLVNNFMNNTKFTDSGSPGELLTTFYENKNFLGMLADKKLLDIINSSARQYIAVLGYDDTSYIEITSWLQLNQPFSYFSRHDHYGSFISGVLYLDVPPGSGDIMFHNPLECRRLSNTFFERAKKEENDYNFSHIKYEPKVGEILLFESWLQHTVMQNFSNENRISIGFNIWVDRDDKN